MDATFDKLQKLLQTTQEGEGGHGLTKEKILSMLSEIKYLKQQLRLQNDIIDRLKQEAYQDPVTNLPNRRMFEHDLDKALSYFRRYHRTGAVLIIDINDFKAINDTLGHLARDAVLKHIGQILKNHTRASDTVARIGGDEFAIILREVDTQQAYLKAQNLAELIAQTPCFYEYKEIYTSVSIGGCCFSEADSRRKILEKADYAMYHSKNSKASAFVA